MGVLTIGSAAVFTEVSSNEHHFGRDRQTNRALNVAEAGLNAGVAAVKNLPPRPHRRRRQRHDRPGLVVVHGHPDAGRVEPRSLLLDITSSGVSPDANVDADREPKGRSDDQPPLLHETIQHDQSRRLCLRLLPGRPGLGLRDLDTGNTFGGNLIVSVDVYAEGRSASRKRRDPRAHPASNRRSTCISARSSSSTATSRRSARPSAKIKSATIVGGCLKSGGRHVQLGVELARLGDNHPSTQNDITQPTIDTNWYTNARPGPTTGCNNDPTRTLPPTCPPIRAGYTAATFKSALFDNDSTSE